MRTVAAPPLAACPGLPAAARSTRRGGHFRLSGGGVSVCVCSFIVPLFSMTQRSVSEYGILGTSLTIYFLAPVSCKNRAHRHHHHPAHGSSQCGPKTHRPSRALMPARAASCGPVRAHVASSHHPGRARAKLLRRLSHIQHSWPSIGIEHATHTPSAVCNAHCA